MTIRKLMIIDMSIFTLLAIIIDFIIARFGFFGISSFVSVGIPLILLLYIRWRHVAVIPHLVISLMYLLIYQASFLTRLSHALAVMTLAVALVFVMPQSFRIRRFSILKVLIIYVVSYAVMMFVEFGLMGLMVQSLPLSSHLLNHLFNFLLGLGLLSIMGFQKELLVDMKDYFSTKPEENTPDA